VVEKQLQHGDVLLKSIEILPKGVKPVQRQNGSLVIMEGEATGHKHVVAEKSANLWELNGQLYLEVTEQVAIQHEEHKRLPVPQGLYGIAQVREFDYFQRNERIVQD
jgi:hypothetical protein